MMKPERDAYGQEIWNCHQGITSHEIVERDDGLIDLGSALPYFEEYKKWRVDEREAIGRAHGRVLDIGCGAGRAALHLQANGHKVLAIDSSPLAVKVTRLRGVKSARVMAIRDIGKLPDGFDTIVLYGNNFGLFGGMASARRILAAMDRITAPDALIIASTMDPYKNIEPIHAAYRKRNRNRGRMGGQLRLRIRYQQYCSVWFDYLLASVDEVRAMVEETRWTLADVVQSARAEYVVILQKR